MYFQRLEDLRIDHDKTQQEIADLLFCQREVYRRYEKGTREIPVWAVIRVAEYYQCSTDYLLGLTDLKESRTELKQFAEPQKICTIPEGERCPFRNSISDYFE